MAVEHLSSQDATVWCCQADEAPLALGGVCFFEGAPLRDSTGAVRIEDVRRRFEAQLEHVPRFRQRLVSPPLRETLVLIDDDHFDIAEQIRLTALPHPGTDAQLRELAGRIIAAPLDPRRPLWEMWVVDGLADDRVALVLKVSHVLADGLSLSRLILSLLDSEPTAHEDAPRVWVPRQAPGPVRLLAESSIARLRHQASLGLQLGRSLADPVRAVASVATAVRAGLASVEMGPPLPITRPVGVRREFAWLALPLTELTAVKRLEQVKLNDVVLAVVGEAMHRYLGRIGTPVDAVRAVVPVAAPRLLPEGQIDNRFSLLLLDVSTAAMSALERLHVVNAETKRRKESQQVAIGPVLFGLGGLVPPRLLRAVGPGLLRHQPFVNLVVTNVPGVLEPRYLLGARMLEAYPYVTVTANLAIMIGAVSYADSLGLGLTVDTDVVPDVQALVEDLRAATADLLAASAAASRA